MQPLNSYQIVLLTFAKEMMSHPNIFGTAATISDCNQMNEDAQNPKVLDRFLRKYLFLKKKYVKSSQCNTPLRPKYPAI